MIPLKSLAFDIDGVVANTMGLFIDILREKHQIHIQYQDITEYDLTQCLDIDFDTIWNILETIMKGTHELNLYPIEHAPRVLQVLSQHTDCLLFVTARPDVGKLHPWFMEMLQLPESKFKIVATGHFKEKIAVLQTHQITHFVDDRMETCRLLDKEGFVPIVFSQPWNRESHSFTEVSTWDEILEMIDIKTNK